jgi:hypothetical protein
LIPGRQRRAAPARIATAVHAVPKIATAFIGPAAANISTPEYLARTAACQSNRYGVFDATFGVCRRLAVEEPGRSCGCLVLIKARLRDQNCPQGLWGGPSYAARRAAT